MNETAKKLREVADYTKDYSVVSTMAIARVRDALGVGKTDTIARDLGAVLDTIADELDELQARAAGANNLRQKLESAEKKAERRKKQVEHTEDAIRERNARLKMRAELLEQAVNENRELRKKVPSERERQILAMWPRFEDGEYVWFGDEFLCRCGKSHACDGVRVQNTGEKVIFAANHPHAIFLKDGSEYDERVKRSAPKVLDADGVEIKVGDTVWDIKDPHGFEMTVDRIELDALGHVRTLCEKPSPSSLSIHPNRLTHTRPDSWERLEEDACNSICGYFGKGVSECDDCPANAIAANSDEFECCERAVKLDIVRRAKRLAGIEVD